MNYITYIYSGVGKFLGKIPFISKIINKLYDKIRYSFFISDENYAKKIYNFEIYENYFSDANKFTILTKDNESGGVSGEIVKFVKEISPNIKNVFLPGENKKTEIIYNEIILNSGGDNINIITAGLSKNVDKIWNFENPLPENIGKFDLIVSQAMIEHIINPYKHICDLTSILCNGGYLIINTNTPGFGYHRYPVDCSRFYPDWFEEIANRLNLTIIKKYMKNGSIFYIYQK